MPSPSVNCTSSRIRRNAKLCRPEPRKLNKRISVLFPEYVFRCLVGNIVIGTCYLFPEYGQLFTHLDIKFVFGRVTNPRAVNFLFLFMTAYMHSFVEFGLNN